MSDELFTLKPKFNFWVMLFPNLFAAIIVVFIAFSVSPLLARFITDLAGALHVSEFLILGLLHLFVFLVAFVTIMFAYYMNYQATTYSVYENKIDFEQGFINHQFTTINMTDIRELHCEQNFIQRMAHLGTIKIVTAANSASSQTGVSFNDIENVYDIYDKLKKLHENKTSNQHE